MTEDDTYNKDVLAELAQWQKKMKRRPGIFNRLSQKVQGRINNFIPEKVHNAITAAIKQLTKAVLYGGKYTSRKIRNGGSLKEREQSVLRLIKNYKRTAAVEGGITGAGGILLGLADFPILLGIKMKMLFDIAAIYGFDTKKFNERVYLLYIFELAFSSDAHRTKVYAHVENWTTIVKTFPEDINAFDWRKFQQEYRDYLDIVKMAQLIPVIGAPVGFVANYRLLKKLGKTAMNAYRMRYFERLTIT